MTESYSEANLHILDELEPPRRRLSLSFFLPPDCAESPLSPGSERQLYEIFESCPEIRGLTLEFSNGNSCLVERSNFSSLRRDRATALASLFMQNPELAAVHFPSLSAEPERCVTRDSPDLI